MAEEAAENTSAEEEKLPLAPFVHLRVHSSYSLSEGALKVKSLPKLCNKFRMPAVAVTDTNNLFGSFEFSTLCSNPAAELHDDSLFAVQPIVGIQARIDIGMEKRSSNPKDPDARLSDIILLVQNADGYSSLRYQSEQTYMFTPDDDEPHVPYDKLKEYSAGLICLAGGIGGPVGRYLLAGKKDKAEEALLRLKDIFPNRLYMEIQRHGLPEEERTEKDFLELAFKHDIPLVATNNVFFETPDMFEAHDILLCNREKTQLIVDDRRHSNPEFYFKSPEEMTALFADLPEAVDNTLVIAKRCGFMLEKAEPALPLYPDCEPFTDPEKDRLAAYEKIRQYLTDDPKTGKTVQEQLESRTDGELREALTVQKQAREGLQKRLEDKVFPDVEEERREEVAKTYFDRLEYELSVIIKMKFSGYFLIVAEFINWSKSHGIPIGPGRGSGAGSCVAWALRITDLDPLKLNLLFERFLNPERVNMPDFDVDFCQTRRGESIEHMRQKYGKESVAQILALGQLQSKAVINMVGRVLQLSGLARKLSKLVPMKPGTTLADAYKVEPEFDVLRREDPEADHLLSIAEKLEGLYVTASTHAAGVVVGQKPLDQIVPVFRDASTGSELPVTQFNMKFVESTGLIKFDFLGLKTLTVIKEAADMINERMRREGKPEIDVDNLDLTDKATFELLQRAETEGVFQLESSGMHGVLRNLMPTKFEEIIAVISLYRPGPMDNIPKYTACKNGAEEPDYMHPMLEDILKETYGIMIYQEQVMQIARKMGGYTMGGADALRKVMGKKQVEKLPYEREKFVTGSVKNGVDKALAESIFESMAKFASYGFNKSHAAAYALVSFQTAYLKAHFPVEFMAATMTYDRQNTDKLAKYKAELSRLGIKLLPPDVNRSGTHFTVENGAVRYALWALKGAGEAASNAIVEERRQNGKYKSMADFMRRLGSDNLDSKTVGTLIKAGAFDSLDKRRGVLFANLNLLMQHAKSAVEERKSSQINLFGGKSEDVPFDLKSAPDWAHEERLAGELEVFGFYLSAHPLEKYVSLFERLRTMTYEEIKNVVARAGSTHARMAVIIPGTVRERTSKKGKKYAFIAASDISGTFEMTAFSEVLSRSRALFDSKKPLLVGVSAERDEGSEEPRLIVQTVESLEEMISKTTDGVLITLTRENAITAVRNILDKTPSGRTHVWIVVQTDDWNVEIALENRYTFSAEVLSDLRKCQGVNEVKEIR